MSEASAALACEGVSVSYGSVEVLRGIDLTVGPGESVTVLGPSGSGKTTLLYTVAGFIAPEAGRVVIGGVAVAAPGRFEPPERRRVGMVFQNYALWPHLDARDTVAFPLRRAGMGRDEARSEAVRLLELMGIGSLAHRRPVELSGGQQQRVGLARALARRADVFLFDEPTAHLDTALRATLQEEIAHRRDARESAALYATHDAAEALAMSDRVALLRDGRVIQVDTPRQIYKCPVDVWAARLTGPASLLEVQAGTATDRRADVEVAGARATIDFEAAGTVQPGPLLLMVRPDWAALGGDLPGVVERVWYRGTHTDYRLETPVGRVEIRVSGKPTVAAGSRTGWTLERAWIPAS